MIAPLARYLIGWRGYFGFCQTPIVLRNLDAWIRRRLRMYIWRQWKNGRTRYAQLRRLGVSHFHAARCCRVGAWALAHGSPCGGAAGFAQRLLRLDRPSSLGGIANRLTRSNRRGTDPYARWCGRGGAARLPPIPINALCLWQLRGSTPSSYEAGAGTPSPQNDWRQSPSDCVTRRLKLCFCLFTIPTFFIREMARDKIGPTFPNPGGAGGESGVNPPHLTRKGSYAPPTPDTEGFVCTATPRSPCWPSCSGGHRAEAQQIVRLRVTLFTDQDDKDDSESVTIDVVGSGNGRSLRQRRPTFGAGQTWDDQSEQPNLSINLKAPVTVSELRHGQIRVAKSCEKGWPVGKGWHACVRKVVGLDDGGHEYLLRGNETSASGSASVKGPRIRPPAPGTSATERSARAGLGWGRTGRTEVVRPSSGPTRPPGVRRPCRHPTPAPAPAPSRPPRG